MSINKIGFVGAGKMGGAILKAIINKRVVSPENVFVYEPNEVLCSELIRDYGIRAVNSNLALASTVDMLVLATKPYLIDKVLKELRPALSSETLILSIAAGVTISHIESIVDSENPVVRAIPNTPVLVGEGMTAISRGKAVSDEQMEFVKSMFSATGKCIVADESLINIITAVSSSGPAFMYSIIDAFAEGGVRYGLTKQMALELAAQTAIGSAKMILESGKHPMQLRDEVTTPGGCTIEGNVTLEKHGVQYALVEAIENTYKKLL